MSKKMFDKEKEEVGKILSEWFYREPEEIIVEREKVKREWKKEMRREHIRFLIQKYFNPPINRFFDTLIYLLLIGIVYIIFFALWQILKQFL